MGRITHHNFSMVKNQKSTEIVNLEVMPDHVHLFIQSKPQQSPNNLIGQIKG